MKVLKYFLAILAVIIMNVSNGQSVKPKKVLVLYYSQTSNTELVAKEIAKRMNADIERIEAVKPYDGDFMATIERCQKEREQGVIPEIKPIKSKLKKYDLIFIGYPIWFGTYAPPIATFLKNTDLSEKQIIAFCTFGSGGLESSLADLFKAQPNAQILGGYGVRAARLDAMPAEIDRFLKENELIEGDYVKLAPFPMPQPVNEDEVDIFKAATDDYPMMSAEAKKVAKREIPNGTEYFFIAVDKPRENRPNMPPAGEMQVFVTVIDGEAPVFTKVVRPTLEE